MPIGLDRLREFHKSRLKLIFAIEESLLNFMTQAKETYEKDIELLRDRINKFLNTYTPMLKLHHESEEKCVCPFMIEGECKLLKSEHIIMMRLIDELRKIDAIDDAEEALSIMKELHALFSKHAKWEEDIFTRLERELTPEELKKINKAIEELYAKSEI